MLPNLGSWEDTGAFSWAGWQHPNALCQPHEAPCQGHVPGPHAPSPSNALADAGMVFCRERLLWKH